MAFPQVKDFQSLLSDDCTIVLDMDQSCFVAASAAEKRHIIARHKKSGVEKIFKNRTAFQGMGKAVGGWLKDENTNRMAKAAASGKNFKPFEKEDFEITDVQTPEPIENCLYLLKLKINNIVERVGLTKDQSLLVLGGKNNFRLRLPAPEQYKSSRTDTLRPVLLQDTRDYCVNHHGAVVIDDIEADDYLAQLGYKGWLNYQKTGKFNYIIASFDKDQFHTPSLILNTQREKDDDDNSHWLYPYPILVDDSMGEIWMVKGKVKGWGQKFMGFQMLFGDTSDHVKPYQPFGIRFGETAAFNIISPCNTEKEMWQAVVDTYKEWFPDGVKFTSFDGQEINYTAGQWASVIFKFVYMQRWENDPTTLSTVLRRVGVIK